jgi:hypothetical protein
MVSKISGRSNSDRDAILPVCGMSGSSNALRLRQAGESDGLVER